MRASLLLAALVFTACGPKGGGSSPPERCDSIAAHLWTTEQEGDPKDREVVVAAMAESCRNDRWSDELIACLEQVTDFDNDERCRPMFTEIQVRHLEDAWDLEAEAAAAPASRFSCFTYVRASDTETVCDENCAGMRDGVKALEAGGAASDVTECAPVPSVWCVQFMDEDDPTCLPSYAECAGEAGDSGLECVETK